MTATPPAAGALARTHAANQARQQATRVKLGQIEAALNAMRRQKIPVTYPAVASRAGVSRTFLYQNPDARNLITAAITAGDDRRRRARAGRNEQAEAAWRQRALNAEDALKAARAEITTQRQRIGLLMGQIRNLEAEYAEDTIQRVSAENTALRQRARQLADDNRVLENKLQAARSNSRFLDKRIASLEAQILDTPQTQRLPTPNRQAAGAAPIPHGRRATSARGATRPTGN